MERMPAVSGTTNLIDILDRVLDKGLVIAGDVRIALANVELLTIRIRLLVCSVDKAEQIGLNWWKFDPNLTAKPTLESRSEIRPGARTLKPDAVEPEIQVKQVRTRRTRQKRNG